MRTTKSLIRHGQADLGLPWTCMSQSTFSHVADHVFPSRDNKLSSNIFKIKQYRGFMACIQRYFIKRNTYQITVKLDK